MCEHIHRPNNQTFTEYILFTGGKEKQMMANNLQGIYVTLHNLVEISKYLYGNPNLRSAGFPEES